MTDIDLAGKNVHFVGIGGISMSGLAEMLLLQGCKVTGSDRTDSPIIHRLRSLGIDVKIGHDASYQSHADVVVYTSAVSMDNPELAAAHRLGKPLISRADLLGQLMKSYRNSIAVCGAHGKTTTTSMVSTVLYHCHKNPTMHIGGILPLFGTATHVGTQDILVMEACEYKDNFLSFNPTTILMLNIDADHLDYFRDIDHITQSFQRFVAKLPEDGVCIYNLDDEHARCAVEGSSCRKITFGLTPGADFSAGDIVPREGGCYDFMLLVKGEPRLKVSLRVNGRHNVLNALGCIATCVDAGVPVEQAAGALELYTGSERRFQKMGQVDGCPIFHDYAHHPTEIKATLSAAALLGAKRLWCVFQPHTYTRTRALFKEFVEAFDECDALVFLDIYSAREKDPGNISSQMLCDAIGERGNHQICRYLPSFEDAADFLAGQRQPGDIVFVLGAGDIELLCPMLLS